MFSLVALSVIACLYYYMSFDTLMDFTFLFFSMLLTGHLDSDPDLGYIKDFLMYCIICGHSTLLKTNCQLFTSLFSTSESNLEVTSNNARSSEAMVVFMNTTERLFIH